MIPAHLTRLEVGSKGIHGCGVGEDTMVTRTPEARPSGVRFSASMGWLMFLPQLCDYNLMFKQNWRLGPPTGSIPHLNLWIATLTFKAHLESHSLQEASQISTEGVYLRPPSPL